MKYSLRVFSEGYHIKYFNVLKNLAYIPGIHVVGGKYIKQKFSWKVFPVFQAFQEFLNIPNTNITMYIYNVEM